MFFFVHGRSCRAHKFSLCLNDMFAQPFGKKYSWNYRMILFLVVQSFHNNVSITSGATFPRKHIYCLITGKASRHSFSESMSCGCFLPGGTHTSRAYGGRKLKATWAGRMESCGFQGAEVERNNKAFYLGRALMLLEARVPNHYQEYLRAF